MRKLKFIVPIFLSVSFCIFIILNIGNRGHYLGDGLSNDAVWHGGINFNHFGFWNLRFVPVQIPNYTVLHPLPVDYKTTAFYTHYPPGVDLVQGGLIYIGVTSRFVHSLISICISLLGSLLLFKALSRFFDERSAYWAWLIMLFSPAFLFFADSLHSHSYFYFFNGLFLYWITQINLESPNINLKKWAPRIFGLALVASWFSLGDIPGFVALGLLFLFLGLKPKAALILFFAAPLGEIVGFFLHVAHNGMVFGGLGPAIEDFVHIYGIRNAITSAEAQNTYSVFRHLVKFTYGVNWFFGFGFIAVAIWGWTLTLKAKTNRVHLGLFLATIIGATAWQVVMRQHSMIHGFTHKLPELFVVCGTCAFFHFFRPGHLAKSLMLIYVGLRVIMNLNSWDGYGVKKWALDKILPNEFRAAWGCLQLDRLKHTQDLHGARALASDLASNCETSIDSSGIRGRLAEVILYWR